MRVRACRTRELFFCDASVLQCGGIIFNVFFFYKIHQRAVSDPRVRNKWRAITPGKSENIIGFVSGNERLMLSE